MPSIARNERPTRAPTAAIHLTGGRVTPGFRDAVFDAAARAGVSVNEMVLRAAGAELSRHAEFPGVFQAGDLSSDGVAA